MWGSVGLGEVEDKKTLATTSWGLRQVPGPLWTAISPSVKWEGWTVTESMERCHTESFECVGVGLSF